MDFNRLEHEKRVIDHPGEECPSLGWPAWIDAKAGIASCSFR